MQVELVQEIQDSEDCIWSVTWSSSGRYLAASGSDQIIRLYTASSSSSSSQWKLSARLTKAHSKSIRWLSFCPGRRQLAAASFDGTVSIWRYSADRDEWYCSATLEGHENEVKSVGWWRNSNGDNNKEEGGLIDEDEERVLFATCGRDKTVWIWSVDSILNGEEDEEEFECLAVLQEHSQDIKSLSWHPKLPILLTGSYDETVRLWGPEKTTGNVNLDDWRSLGLVKLDKQAEGTIWNVQFSGDGRLAAIVDANAVVTVFRVPEGLKEAMDTRLWRIERTLKLHEAESVQELKVIDDNDDGEGCCGGKDKSNNNNNSSGCCSDDKEEKSGNGCCKDDKGKESSGGCCDNEHQEEEATHSEEEEGGCCGGGSNKETSTQSCCKSTNNKNTKKSNSPKLPPPPLYSLSFNCTSKFLAVASASGSIAIIDLSKEIIDIQASRSDVHWIHVSPLEINSVAWSPLMENVLAVGGDDGCLRIYSLSLSNK